MPTSAADSCRCKCMPISSMSVSVALYSPVCRGRHHDLDTKRLRLAWRLVSDEPPEMRAGVSAKAEVPKWMRVTRRAGWPDPLLRRQRHAQLRSSQAGTDRPGTRQLDGDAAQQEGTFCLVKLEPELFCGSGCSGLGDRPSFEAAGVLAGSRLRCSAAVHRQILMLIY